MYTPTQEDRFVDFIADNLGTTYTKYKSREGREIGYQKTFKRNGQEYTLMAQFTPDGQYLRGMITNEAGAAEMDCRTFGFDYSMDLFEQCLNFLG